MNILKKSIFFVVALSLTSSLSAMMNISAIFEKMLELDHKMGAACLDKAEEASRIDAVTEEARIRNAIVAGAQAAHKIRKEFDEYFYQLPEQLRDKVDKALVATRKEYLSKKFDTVELTLKNLAIFCKVHHEVLLEISQETTSQHERDYQQELNHQT